MTYKVLVLDPDENGVQAQVLTRDEVDQVVEKIVKLMIKRGSLNVFLVKVTTETAGEETYTTHA